MLAHYLHIVIVDLGWDVGLRSLSRVGDSVVFDKSLSLLGCIRVRLVALVLLAEGAVTHFSRLCLRKSEWVRLLLRLDILTPFSVLVKWKDILVRLCVRRSHLTGLSTTYLGGPFGIVFRSHAVGLVLS